MSGPSTQRVGVESRLGVVETEVEALGEGLRELRKSVAEGQASTDTALAKIYDRVASISQAQAKVGSISGGMLLALLGTGIAAFSAALSATVVIGTLVREPMLDADQAMRREIKDVASAAREDSRDNRQRIQEVNESLTGRVGALERTAEANKVKLTEVETQFQAGQSHFNYAIDVNQALINQSFDELGLPRFGPIPNTFSISRPHHE